MTLFGVALVLFVLTAFTDAYTTKRAILDHYHGWVLGVGERNRLIRALWSAVGVNKSNAWTPGKQFEGVAVLVVHKAAVGAATVWLWRYVPTAGVVGLFAFSALQAWASIANRRLLHAKRRWVDSRR